VAPYDSFSILRPTYTILSIHHMTTAQDFAQQADQLRHQEFARLADAIPPTLDSLRGLMLDPFCRQVSFMFERLGYEIITHATGPDFIMVKERHKYLVACAAPTSAEPTRTRSLVHLHEAVTASSAQAGYAVTAHSFTAEARAYAATAPLHLLDGDELARMMQQSKAGGVVPDTYQSLCRQCGAQVQHHLDHTEAVPCPQGHLVAPTIARAALLGQREKAAVAGCALCGAPMRLKDGKHGKFWGCSQYPACRSTKPYMAPKVRRAYGRRGWR